MTQQQNRRTILSPDLAWPSRLSLFTLPWAMGETNPGKAPDGCFTAQSQNTDHSLQTVALPLRGRRWNFWASEASGGIRQAAVHAEHFSLQPDRRLISVGVSLSLPPSYTHSLTHTHTHKHRHTHSSTCIAHRRVILSSFHFLLATLESRLREISGVLGIHGKSRPRTEEDAADAGGEKVSTPE